MTIPIINGKEIDNCVGLDRATQFLQHHDPTLMKESQDVSMFLAKQKIIRDTLKERLNAVDGYEDLLIEIIHNSAQMYDNKVYVLPAEKHTHVIVSFFTVHFSYHGSGKF